MSIGFGKISQLFLEKMTAAGINPEAALADNDSYHALRSAGALIVTGPTGTNVNDLTIVLTE